ncbi:MAG: hypothetical protein Alpg2KO_22750 [Alphaproteobacteria bacterium]
MTSQLSDRAVEAVRRYVQSEHELAVEEVSGKAEVWPKRYFKIEGETLAKLAEFEKDKANYPIEAQKLADEFGAIGYTDFGGRECRLIFPADAVPAEWDDTTSYAKDGPTCVPAHDQPELAERVGKIAEKLNPKARLAAWLGWSSVKSQGMATSIPGNSGYGGTAGITFKTIGDDLFAEITPVAVNIFNAEKRSQVERKAITYPIPPGSKQLTPSAYFELQEQAGLIQKKRTGTLPPVSP